MNEKLYNLGFYICKVEDTPKYLNEISNKLISLSECLCTHEPQICLCHDWKPNGDSVEYMEKLGLTLKQYLDYSNEVQNIFEKGRYFIDGRFSNEEDAKYFYGKYFNNQQYILISFATEYEYYAVLTDNNSFRQSKQLVSMKEKQILGCDIIGFDISSFHSFLCNSLQKKFEYIPFSEYGLIDLDFLTVKEMCKNIRGLGEPVDWIPVIVFEQL
ncbi:MAG: hypothetical protein NC429_11880 [Lachnospiraceae bacterium]|nr:hypothetical protein [Lachnospiraceae bacterium]